MDNKMDIKVDFACKICNKFYSSYKSLWNHNRKFHNNIQRKCSINVQNCSTNVQNCSINVQNCSINKSLICDYCNKVFNNRSTKSMHKKICIKICIYINT